MKNFINNHPYVTGAIIYILCKMTITSVVRLYNRKSVTMFVIIEETDDKNSSDKELGDKKDKSQER